MYSAFFSGDFLRRVGFLIFALLLYRFGGFITIPLVDPSYLGGLLSQTFGSGIFGTFDLFAGGALGRMTIFALNVMPYIVSSIVVQIFIALLKSEGKIDSGFDHSKVSFYSRILCIFLSLFQASVMIFGLQRLGVLPAEASFFDKSVCVSTLVGGALLLVWLGGQITSRGIGNGISMIIFTGIVAELPSSLSNIFSSSGLGSGYGMLLCFAIILLVVMIVFFEKSYRNVSVSYPVRHHGIRRAASASPSFIPIKINVSGVIPPIFASAIVLFPLTLAESFKNSDLGSILINYLAFGQPLYFLFYCVLIAFFSFFYADFVFSTKDLSDSLKKSGAIVAGKRPGIVTKQYLDYVLSRITVLGASYLCFVCVLPDIIKSLSGFNFAVSGTSLLIMASVAMDFVSQLQIHAFNNRYSSLSKNKGFAVLNR